VNSPDYT